MLQRRQSICSLPLSSSLQPRASLDCNITLLAARSRCTAYLPMGLLVFWVHCIKLLPQSVTMLVLVSHHHLVEGCFHCVTQHLVCSEPHSPKNLSKDLFISLSRMLMEHPESMYLQTSANQNHWSFMLDSSFSLGSTTLQFMHLSKVPWVHLSMEVLAPKVMTNVIKAESKSLSSE